MAGKVLSIIGGTITLLSTYLLVLFVGGAGGVHGAGLFMVVINMFSNAGAYVVPIGIPIWAVYIVAVGVILYLLAGLFQLIGAKVRALGIIFSLFPLALGIIVLLGSFGLMPWMANLDFMGHPLEFVPGILPYNLETLYAGIGLSTYPLILGGLLGLIGGLLPRD
jgi:hypothetical protein